MPGPSPDPLLMGLCGELATGRNGVKVRIPNKGRVVPQPTPEWLNPKVESVGHAVASSLGDSAAHMRQRREEEGPCLSPVRQGSAPSEGRP